MTRCSLIIAMMTAAVLTGCGQDESQIQSPPASATPEPAAAEPEHDRPGDNPTPTKYIFIGDAPADAAPKTLAEPEAMLKLDLEPEPVREPEVSYRRLTSPKPYHYANIKRWDIRIEIPRGRSRDDVRATLEKAALDFRAQRGGHAIEVLAFAPGDDPNGQSTVGRGMLAPNGKWADAGGRGPMQFRVLSLRDKYFAPADEIDVWKPGTVVSLVDSSGSPVRLSNRWDEWGEDREVALVPSGTKATVIRKKIEPLIGSHELVRYRVKVENEGETVWGWVHREVVEHSGATGP